MRVGDLSLVASATRHPSAVLTTDDLEHVLPNVEPGWIAKRLGMHSRRVAAAHERVADLGSAALEEALARAGWSGADLDLIVCGASFLEDLMPARSSVIAEKVNPSAVAFDVNAACSSFLYALAVAGSMLRSDPSLRQAAVAVVERPSDSADYRDSHSSAFFGDAAAAVLLQLGEAGRGFVVESLVLKNDAIGSEDVRLPRHGHFKHDNREAFRHVLELGEQVVCDALAEAQLGVDDVRVMVGHQANEAVLSALGERLGLPWSRQWHNFEWAGNQGAAGVLTAFAEGWNATPSELHPGDHVVLNAVGSGYSAGAAVLRWIG